MQWDFGLRQSTATTGKLGLCVAPQFPCLYCGDKRGAGMVTQLVVCLPSMYRPWV